MNKIISKEHFSEKVFKLVIEAPLIAKSRKAGHFVIVRVGEKGERMPLTIAEADPVKGTITLVVQEVGLSSTRLCELNEGDYITDVVGPLGQATHIDNFGTVVCAGGGVGVAPMLPIVQALKAAGNRVITVLAGRTKELIILEKEMRESSDEVIIMTDDGSYGRKGLVTEGVEEVIKREKVNKCFAIGPAIMMKFVCLLTKKYEIPTDVSLNTIMVDGTGMCGACRITIGGKTKFVCVDGPEFDGHQVDFDEMLKRMGAFKNIEREEMHKLEEPQTCQATGENMEDEKSRNAAWRQELRKSMKAKERTAIPRVEMNELDAEYRSHSRKEEVNQGLTKEQALTEAKRCLDCANPGCTEGCPVGIDIPRFIKNIERGEFLEAAKTLKETSALPAVCGRVCPQEKQCESKCIHLKMNEKSVAIGYLERFAADYERESGQISIPEIKEKNGIKVAVIGSGPAGLSFAGDMAKYGYDVTVFEALHEIGGVLKYGIPEFRLPNKVVDVEIDNLAKMGVEFVKDCIIGKTLSVEQLEEEGFKGIFVASGAGLPNFMNIPGENSINILSSNEYLTRVNLMDAASEDSDTPVPFGKCVAVIGGGNTAMDSVRTARRLGAARALIIYRRSEEEMPARIEEVKHAKEEGVEFLALHNPIEYIADEQGKVKQVVLQKMELGEPDASGRRSPVPIPGATETIDIDLAIVSVGVSPNPIVPSSIKGLELGRKGTIAVNDNMQSSIPTIFAGGDIVRGEFLEAAKTLKETSALPAVCGRVCPQEKQCESKCIHLKMNEKSVAIGYLERFAADYERESGQISIPEIKEKNGIKVAVIGSGPAGLSFAGDMAKYGYDVTVFEALHEIGGVLKYGIPEFRLPNKVVDVEIDNLAKMGVEFVKDCIIGKTLSVEQLEEEGFKGIFVASGAGLPNFMNIPGENSINILSSNEYLTRVNLMDAASEDSDTPVPFGKCVAVIGGGNTAMDSVRTARRLGAARALIIYRRSEEEMPARIEEVKHAKEEGVEFLALHNPIEYIADEQGKVKQVVLQKMELGEPDASGRRSPVPIPGATETIDIDLAIVSVGVSPNPIVPSSIKGLELGRKGTIAVNDNMQSSIPTIFAGGDIVRGGATVILAMGDGRKAAAAMNEQLKK